MRGIDLIMDENESQVVEWKESWQDKYLEWICGYANAQGGTLYIGVDDDGNVLGLEDKIVKKLLEDIPNKITAAFGMTCDVNLKTRKEELKPVFYTDGYNFFLTLWNLNYAFDKAQNKAQNKAQKSQMTDREYLLLLLKENPSLTQVELSEMMDKSRRTVQMLMKELLDEGAIERIGSKKKVHGL